MKIRKSELPAATIVTSHIDEPDYVDSYTGSFNDKHDAITPQDVGKAFFSSAPRWTESLMTFRNALVSVAGLKTGKEVKDKKYILENFKCEPGDRVGLFKVIAKTNDEVVFGEDDKHLNFHISFFISPPSTLPTARQLTISTVVKFNNWLGRLYFIPVKPFHRFIVPAMIKATIRELEKESAKVIHR